MSYVELSDADKVEIRRSTVYSLEYEKYGIEMLLEAENAKAEPSQENIQRLLNLISDKEAQIIAIKQIN